MIALWMLACTSVEPTPTDTDTGTLEGLRLRAITYNTGTTQGLPHEADLTDGYGDAEALLSDTWYGDGMAYPPAIDAVTAFLARADADIIAFQEIFDPNDCPTIPPEAQLPFICSGWSPGDPTVAEAVTGAGYQVVCHPGKSDKCLAVHERVGVLQDPLEGREVDGCGSGSRVARAVIPGVLTIVSVHGNSGVTGEDQDCRARMVDEIFGGDAPLADAPVTLILGDLNTDPGRWAEIDSSAAAWQANVGEGTEFEWLTDIGPDAEPNYQTLVNIDHMAGRGITGSCFTEGISEGTSVVYSGTYFDHHPVVCDLRIP